MAKIKLLQKLWRREKGEIVEVAEHLAQFAIRKLKAVLVEETKPQFAPENKAERKPRKNKGNAN